MQNGSAVAARTGRPLHGSTRAAPPSGEVLRPVVSLHEGVAVEQVGHVDSTTGVGVLRATCHPRHRSSRARPRRCQPGSTGGRRPGPDMPAPITATRNGRSGASSSRRQLGARRSSQCEDFITQELEVVVGRPATGDEGQQGTKLVERERPLAVGGVGSESLDRGHRQRLRLLHLGGRQPVGRCRRTPRGRGAGGPGTTDGSPSAPASTVRSGGSTPSSTARPRWSRRRCRRADALGRPSLGSWHPRAAGWVGRSPRRHRLRTRQRHGRRDDRRQFRPRSGRSASHVHPRGAPRRGPG